MVVASSSASTLRLMGFILQKSTQLFGHFVGKVKVPISHVFEAKDQSLGTSWYTLRRNNKKAKNKDCGKAVINYGASWCGVCSQILPTFCELSGKFLKVSFVYADIDECPETTQHIRYTPTFHFYRDGERVDEMFGVGEERLQDRLWLHS